MQGLSVGETAPPLGEVLTEPRGSMAYTVHMQILYMAHGMMCQVLFILNRHGVPSTVHSQ
jgi:hypothetical protein